MSVYQGFLIPVPDRVLFPSIRSVVRLNSDDYEKFNLYFQKNEEPFVIVCRRKNRIGVICRVIAKSNGIVIEAFSRIRLVADQPGQLGDMVSVEVLPDTESSSNKNLIFEVSEKIAQLVKLESKSSANFKMTQTSSSPTFAYVIASGLLFSQSSGFVQRGILTVDDAQDLLETRSAHDRLTKLSALLDRCIEGSRISNEVNETIRKKNETELKQILIKRQIAELQNQLRSLGDDGEGGGENSLDEIGIIKKKIATLALPKEVGAIVAKELKRIDGIQNHHPEYHGIITYLENVVALPWTDKNGGETIDLKRAQDELDNSHYGMLKVKKRILEFLSVEKLLQPTSSKHSTSVLCLHGGPGLGKTSIATSIARALGRKFIRISLGGVRDESELRGHRKTYIGAMPGLLVQSLIRSGVKNPVILLDEVDKISTSHMRVPGGGSPESVLLEILDPEQNFKFRDSYLNFGIDLSQCLFICTCNSVRSLSRPLLDRLEVVTIDGYLEHEKIEIGRRYLLPKSMKNSGINNMVNLTLSNDMLKYIVNSYTAEVGVRSLGRKLDDICRHFASQLAAGSLESKKSIFLDTEESVRKILGPSPIADGPVIPTTQLPLGIALGLAVTEIGGDVLFIESVRTAEKGTGKILITGQLGDVMKESVQACISLLLNRSLNKASSGNTIYAAIDPAIVRYTDIHVHFPNGSIPKDGPSAGVSTSIALASLFSGQQARSDLASTGEITLRGEILPIGGVREKLVAAHKAGLKTVILPWGNRTSLKEGDLPAEVQSGLEVVYVRTIDQVMAVAFPHARGVALATPSSAL
jgi:ATP-dependent Lon protease